MINKTISASEPMPAIPHEGAVQWVISMDACGTSYWKYVAVKGTWQYQGSFGGPR